MKVLFLVPYQLDKAPGQRFRFEYYSQYLESNGIQCTFRPFLDQQTNDILYKPGNLARKIYGIIKGYAGRLRDLITARKSDFVFIFREAAPAGPPVIEWILARIFHKRIIYDFDDAIWINDPIEGKFFSLIKYKQKVKSICKWSHTVVCGNQYLAEFAKFYNSNVKIIPTVINTDTYLPSGSSGVKPVIGWTGSHSTLIYLNDILPVLRELKKKYDFTFRVIANEKPDFTEDFMEFVPWNSSTEVTDLQPIDIGIMPLTVTPWSEGKCGLKILQYHALAIPAVASDVGVNAKIIRNGENGYICRTQEDWHRALSALLENPELRKKMGGNGRAQTVRHYSVVATKMDFLNLFRT